MPARSLLLAALAASLSASAFAQRAPAETPAPPPAEAEGQGLSDLTTTVQTLEDQAPPAPPQAPPSTPAPAPAPATPPPASAAAAPALTAEQVAAINRAAARGRELVAVARAGMLATQDMLTRVPNPEGAGIDGWIAEAEGTAMVVTFFADSNEGPKTVYRATVLGGRVTSRDTFLGTFKPPLSRGQARLAAARTVAVGAAADADACGGAGFNYLVLPPAAAGEPVSVYRISAQSGRGRFPAGGHYRYRVTAAGEIVESHPFATACSQFEAGEAPAAGQAPPPIAITGQADPLPSEVHVLLSQMSGRALVFTAGAPPRQWLVAGERIAEIRDGAPRFVTTQN